MRRFKIVLILSIAATFISCWAVRDHVRTMLSLQRVDGTNIYVMDYYANYDMEEIRRDGMDIEDVEGSYIRALLPNWIAPIALQLKSSFVPDDVPVINSTGHHCSTIAWHSKERGTFFGRNFDSGNDALLVLRIHGSNAVDSVSIIDLQYLNLNRSDLTESSLIERIPLLFAPYYVMDGMNQHGLAVSAMTVPTASAPEIPDAPHVTQATLMRLIIDYCKSVDEAIGLVAKYNIAFSGSPEHIMLADADGNMAVVEFLDGETRVIEPSQNWLTCTNHNLWKTTEEWNDSVCSRYRAGSEAMALAETEGNEQDFVNAVRAMSVENWTMWTSIYDLDERTVTIMYKAKPEQFHLETALSVAR